MSSIPSTGSSATSAASGSERRGNGLQDLDLDQFLKLMITDLQNQDPLNPTDNAALLQQVGELRQLSANDKLTSTLNSFSTTQQLTTASTLIGKNVTGLDDSGTAISGVVDSVSVKIDEKDRNIRQVKVIVDGKTVDISNVREIVAPAASSASSATSQTNTTTT